MAALRMFARGIGSPHLQSLLQPSRVEIISPLTCEIQKRWSRYGASPVYEEGSKWTDYEISQDPKEWMYVERLLRYKSIPEPKVVDEDKSLPSGWKPSTAKPNDYTYFVRRTKNHMLPVYLDITYRGTRRITEIRKIEGNIWDLHAELHKQIEKVRGRHIGYRINELAGRIYIRADVVNFVKKWLLEKGF